MGSGISLSEYHIAEIIKRDLEVSTQAQIRNIPKSNPYANYHAYLLKSSLDNTNRDIDSFVKYKKTVHARNVSHP
jgi:hypothetical protein